MIPCNEIELLISAAIDDEVDPHEWELLNTHLAECERCAKQSEALERVDQILTVTAASPAFEMQDRFNELNTVQHRERVFWRVAGLSTAALVLIALGISTTVQPERAEARNVSEP